MEQLDAFVGIESGPDAGLYGPPVCLQLPLRTVDALLKETKEQDCDLARTQSRQMPRKGTGKKIEVAQVVMRHLVGDHKRHALFVGAALKQSTPEVDVASRCGERREGLELRNFHDKPARFVAVELEPGGHVADAVGHEPVLFEERVGTDLCMEPVAEPCSWRDFEIGGVFVHGGMFDRKHRSGGDGAQGTLR